MASEGVLKYLIDSNRPYSCADVTVNLRGAFTKSAVQKALDALSESGKIRCKLYGKQKVFVAIQPENAVDDSDIEDYDSKVKTLTQIIAQKSGSLKKAEIDFKVLTSTPKTSDAKSLIEEKNENVAKLEQKLSNLKGSTQNICVDDTKALLGEHSKLLREYRKRKRICTDMLESILEGYPKPKKTLLEELCLETDDMVDFKLLSTN